MTQYAHRFRLRFASAFRDACLSEPYTRQRLIRDLIAGVTVGIIAIPLAMALAVASGVPPQHGLYTAMIAGFLIALTGGSRFSVSGPTAAFVVILQPVAVNFGLGGLLVATLLAGVILVGMAVARLGRLIEYIPEAVTPGFTCGSAVAIAVLQLTDFPGLDTGALPEWCTQQLAARLAALPSLDWGATLVGATTLALLIFWPRLRLPIPGHLPALLAGVAVSLLLLQSGHEVATIGSEFSWVLNGESGRGIPPVLPQFNWPWL